MYSITKALLVGRTKVNSELVVSLSSDSGKQVTANYEWFRSSVYDGVYTKIVGESGPTYTITFNDSYIKCLVTGTGEFSGQVFTNTVVVDSRSTPVESLESISKISTVGSGLNLSPMVSEVSGTSNIVSDIARINQSIHIILSTAKKEVPMIPELGSNIHLMIFEGVTGSLLDMIRLEVESALISQEPRINIIEVLVDYDGDHTIPVTVKYSIKNTNIKSSYIYNVNLDDGRSY